MNTQPNYIDRLAIAIHRTVEPNGSSEEDLSLYRLYALLLLTKGGATTDEDVHNAWSVWACGADPQHRSLVPFNQLPPAVQDLDTPYTAAIHAVSRIEADPAMETA